VLIRGGQVDIPSSPSSEAKRVGDNGWESVKSDAVMEGVVGVSDSRRVVVFLPWKCLQGRFLILVSSGISDVSLRLDGFGTAF
jgi:hypothetical protein